MLLHGFWLTLFSTESSVILGSSVRNVLFYFGHFKDCFFLFKQLNCVMCLGVILFMIFFFCLGFVKLLGAIGLQF